MAFMAFIDTLFFVAPVPIVDALVLQIDQCFLTNALLPFFFQESADPIFVSTRLFQYIVCTTFVSLHSLTLRFVS